MKPQDFWRIYHALYPRRWLLAALLVVSLSLVAAVCAATPRYYRASAFVMPSESALTKPVIPGTAAGLVNTAPRSADSRRLEEQLATLIGLAKTGEVRQRAIKSLKLKMNPSQLEKMVLAEPGEGNLIRISALAKSPSEAVHLANAIAHEFTAYYQDISSHQAKQNRAFLEEELGRAETDLAVVRVELQSLKSAHGEASISVGTAENPFATQFYALRGEVDSTHSQLNGVEGRLRGIRSELHRQSPLKRTETSTSENPETDKLTSELAQLQYDLLDARARYTDKHKKVIELKNKMADVTARLTKATGQLKTTTTIGANPIYERLSEEITTYQADRQALSAKLVALQQAMGENERRAAELADTSVVLAEKTAKFDAAKMRYEELKQMVDNAKLEEKVSSSRGEIQVVDEAKSADGPVTKGGPSLANLILLGVFLSLGLSFGSVTALAFLDSRVRERQDLQAGLGLPVPTVVPVVIDDIPGRPIARVTELDPTSAQAEAYRYLRAQLLYHKGSPPVRTILLATAKPAQGGTTTAANLALALAEVGQQVVLIDCDLRRPSLHKLFGVPNGVGLTDVLRGEAAMREELLVATDMPTLRLLTAGSPTANPASLLSSSAMGSLLDLLRGMVDYIVIDAPSLGAFADAMMLGPLVDGVILVARANQSLSHIEQQAKEMLERVGANIIGAVLNAASPDRVTNWYYHKHYYGGADVPSAAPPSKNDHDAGTPAAPSTSAPTRAAGSRHHVRMLILSIVMMAVAGGLLYVGTHPRRMASRPAKAVVLPQPHALTLVADIQRPTRVRVTRDGELIYDGLLEGGQQIWQADRALEVWAERPEALSLTLNKRALGPLGQPGSAPFSRRFSVEEEQAQ